MLALLQVWNSGAVFLNFMFFTVTPLHTAIADGGTITLIMGVAMYLTHKNRKLQAIVYAILVVLWDIVRIRYLAGPCNPILFFTDYYEWYEIFSVIFMLLYNGQRGHGSKKLFYWFYPVHIYLLYALSCILI